VLFTRDKPVVFAYHGYPSIVHRFTYNRTNHTNFHVHGFIEEGTTTTPFDMVVRNELDRYHLALAAIERVPSLGARGAGLRERCEDKLAEHAAYITRRGEDLPDVREWVWPH
jgi:xylulose-5-phosphate/fructose-6-phosphate phosphoketolase